MPLTLAESITRHGRGQTNFSVYGSVGYTIEKKAGSNSESSGLTEVKQPFQSCLIGFFCGFLCSESKKLNVC